MKNIYLKSLKLYHFKGIKNLKIDFSNAETTISGKNGSGKTTVFDAFTFLLFGKDSHGKTNFNIKMLDENGVPESNIEHTVEGVLSVDGELVTLKKIYKENWVKKKGELQPELKGHETLCYIDEVPKKISEFQKYISEIVDETIFKQITNPKYFASLPWKTQRDILFTISGVVSDEEIAQGNADYEALLKKLSGKKMEDYLKQIASEKKKIKKDLDAIPTRIDEVEKNKPETENFTTIEEELNYINRSICDIDNSLTDANLSFKKQSEENQKIYSSINDLKSKQNQILSEANQDNMEGFYTQKNKRREIERSLENTQIELKNQEREASNIAKELERKQTEIATLREDYSKEYESEYIAQEGKLICPIWNHACGDAKALELYQNNQNKAKETFNTNKVENLNAINEKGQDLAKEVAEIETKINTISNKIVKSKEDISSIQNQLANTSEPKEPAKIEGPTLPEWVKISSEIENLEKSIQPIGKIDNSKLLENKRLLQENLDQLKARLSKKSQIEKAENRVEELKTEQKKLSQMMSDLEKDEFTINNFTKDRITEAENRINSRFSYVKFKLFNTQVNGSETETCEMTINGVPYSDANTASRVNAGIDVINVLSQFYGVIAPIFVDNRESVSELIENNAQIVNLVVNKELKKLTIE